jgi:hypothetical protein
MASRESQGNSQEKNGTSEESLENISIHSFEENLHKFENSGVYSFEEVASKNNFYEENTEDNTDYTNKEDDDYERDVRNKDFLFYLQGLTLFIIILACIINLSLNTGDKTAWTALLSTCVGIMLPSPGTSLKGNILK